MALLRSRLEGLGPVSAAMLAESLGVAAVEILTALAALEAEGSVMRGRFTPEAQDTEWCERGLLARIHRYTLGRLRQQIQPVPPSRFYAVSVAMARHR